MSEKKQTALEIIADKMNGEKIKSAINLVAPPGYAVDRHLLIALDQVKKSLTQCNNLVPSSVLNAVYQAGSMGLSFDPMKKEAYLVPFNTKICKNPVTYGTMVTLIPGYKGLQKLCINAGMLKMSSKVIYEEDEFDYNENDGETTYTYKPTFKKERGDAICVLTVAYMNDGTKDIRVLPYHKILETMQRAKSQNGPWETHEEEMAQKTGSRRHCNQLPQSFEDKNLATAIKLDEMAEAGKPMFYTPQGMEDIVDADYQNILNLQEENNEPQSSKPVVNMPIEKQEE